MDSVVGRGGGAFLALITLCLAACASTPPRRAALIGIRASSDPAIIERGRYIVRGPAHCAACHGPPGRQEEIRRGLPVALSGGRRFDLGIAGRIVAPNITPDRFAGIGAVDDATLVRALRYGRSRSGRTLAPFMSFAGMSDRDLQAVISFLRAQEPDADPAPPSELTWLGSLALSFFIEPQQPEHRPPQGLTRAPTADYGGYLARSVANCRGCHTQRSRITGAFNGPDFAGGLELIENGRTFVTPNLTAGPGGILRTLDERNFLARFRTRGREPGDSPMPWAAFAQMTDEDLIAIYRYLETVTPARSRRA